jgi:hypothetical protein
MLSRFTIRLSTGACSPEFRLLKARGVLLISEPARLTCCDLNRGEVVWSVEQVHGNNFRIDKEDVLSAWSKNAIWISPDEGLVAKLIEYEGGVRVSMYDSSNGAPTWTHTIPKPARTQGRPIASENGSAWHAALAQTPTPVVAIFGDDARKTVTVFRGDAAPLVLDRCAPLHLWGYAPESGNLNFEESLAAYGVQFALLGECNGWATVDNHILHLDLATGTFRNVFSAPASILGGRPDETDPGRAFAFWRDRGGLAVAVASEHAPAKVGRHSCRIRRSLGAAWFDGHRFAVCQWPITYVFDASAKFLFESPLPISSYHGQLISVRSGRKEGGIYLLDPERGAVIAEIPIRKRTPTFDALTPEVALIGNAPGTLLQVRIDSLETVRSHQVGDWGQVVGMWQGSAVLASVGGDRATVALLPLV